MRFAAILDGIDSVTRPIEVVYSPDQLQSVRIDDLKYSRLFLASYAGSKDTFTAYRRDIERLLMWLWYVEDKSLVEMTRHELSAFLNFVKQPPKDWVSEQVCARWFDGNLTRPNPNWRPFSARGKKVSDYQLSDSAMKAMIASISTYLTFLVQEHYLQQNVMMLIRQKSRYVQKQQESIITRKLTQKQWRYVLSIARSQAEGGFEAERALFILSAFYLLGLRISELSVTERHTPTMGSFFRDEDDLFWYAVVGKGNKYREIAVSDQMLEALIRYRLVLGLPELPRKAEQTLLLPKVKGRGGLGSRQIRKVVMGAFNNAVHELRSEGDKLSADDLEMATVHWLRHTAISSDVLHRPAEHVRDDAGHENITITDRYINVSRRKRHLSAQGKVLLPDEEES